MQKKPKGLHALRAEREVVMEAEMSDVGRRARQRIAYRLLPFVFLIYIVNYIDRVNVSLNAGTQGNGSLES